MMTRQRLEGGTYKAGGVKGSWQGKKLREHGTDSPLETSREHGTVDSLTLVDCYPPEL